MFLSLADALDEISETIKSNLGPLGNFQFEWKYGIDIIIQLSATIILFLAIRFLFWKPITKILETRKKAIDKELDDARIAKENAVKAEQEMSIELERARQQIKEMLSNAEKEAGLKASNIIDAAKKEAELRRKNLNDELELEKKNMADDIKKEIVNIAFEAAEKIVGREINQNKYFDVVDDILKGAE